MAICRLWPLVLISSLTLLGCGSLPPDITPSFKEVEQHYLPQQMPLDLGDHEREARINTLVGQSLEPTQAIELLLINSPQVRAALAELGIAQAQQVQAGLLRNPRFALGALRPEGGGRWVLDAGISQSILDIFTRPLRKQLADTELISAQLKLYTHLNQQIHELQYDYYRTIATNELAQLQEMQHQASKASLSLAQSLFKAGNIPERHLLQYQLEEQTQKRQLHEVKIQAQQQTIALGTRLGLNTGTVLKLPKTLPLLPTQDHLIQADPVELFKLAREARSDLQLAQTQVRTAENMLALQQKSGAFTEIDLGAKFERESDGNYKAGPQIAFGLPLFDRGHARIQRASAAIQRAQALLQAQEIQAEADITSALLALNGARLRVEQIEQIALPLQHKVQALTLREYNFMLSSAFELIQVKQREFDLARERISALQAYWQARSNLALVTGQSLAVTARYQPAAETIAPEVDHSMHHHGDHHHD